MFGLFSKKIVLNDTIENFIWSYKNINWFNNCGKKYDEKLYFQYVSLEDMKTTSKRLNQTVNSKGFTFLEKLLEEADGRLDWYLYNNHKKENQITQNNLKDFIKKRFNKKTAEINFNITENKYIDMFSIKENRYNWFYWIFGGVIMEMYFLEYIPNIPTFYTKIFKILQDGHMIIGWEGKFSSQDLCLETPITEKDGKLIIY
jgi:hypothetical protein